MRKAEPRPPVAVLARILAGVILAGCLLPAAADEDDAAADTEAVSRSVQYQGQPAVRLEPAMQDEAGIGTARLERETVVRESRATGRVTSLTPLLDQRSRFFRLQAERRMTAASLDYDSRRVKRLGKLHAMESNISARELQEAQLQHDKDAIHLEELDGELSTLRDQVRQEWGGVLAGWALHKQASPLDGLLDLEQVLVLVQAPDGIDAGAAGPIYVNRVDERGGAREAQFISAATRADDNRRGNTWYFRTAAADLRAGMNLYVWIPDASRQTRGYVLPRDAVVWFNGSPWYYTRVAPDIFVKQPVGDHVEAAGGWLLPGADLAGRDVVVRGAQLLLSEEYRRQIPDEDED